ncbi:MAG: hypothetical protein AB1476_02895 [Candidatus Hadarchaeota archaeon]
MEVALWLFGILFLFGPMAGASYSLANGIPPLETAAIVSALHVALVPVWFGILRLLRYEFHYFNRITRVVFGKIKATKRLEKVAMKGLEEFERKFKGWSLGTAVFGFTFLLGVSWAALLASIMNIKLSTIFFSVAAGAAASSIFWTVALSSVGGFLPEPWMLYVIVGAITILVLVEGKIKEKRTLREMFKSLKRAGLILEPSVGEKKKRKKTTGKVH